MPREENRKNWAAGHLKERFEPRKALVVDCGYNRINDVKWGNVL